MKEIFEDHKKTYLIFLILDLNMNNQTLMMLILKIFLSIIKYQDHYNANRIFEDVYLFINLMY